MKIKYKNQEIDVNIVDDELIITSLEDNDISDVFKKVIKPMADRYIDEQLNPQIYGKPSDLHG